MISLIDAKSQDGTIYCKFQRSANATNSQIFPLDKSYTLLVARGPPSGKNRLEYHSSREVLSGQVNLQATQEGGATGGAAGGIHLESGGDQWLDQKTIEALVKSHGKIE